MRRAGLQESRDERQISEGVYQFVNCEENQGVCVFGRHSHLDIRFVRFFQRVLGRKGNGAGDWQGHSFIDRYLSGVMMFFRGALVFMEEDGVFGVACFVRATFASGYEFMLNLLHQTSSIVFTFFSTVSLKVQENPLMERWFLSSLVTLSMQAIRNVTGIITFATRFPSDWLQSQGVNILGFLSSIARKRTSSCNDNTHFPRLMETFGV